MASDRLRQYRTEKRVILDSNSILMLFEFSIDLENELTQLVGKFKIIIPSPIVEELKFLSNSGDGKKRQNAKAALQLIKNYEIVNIQGPGDDAVLRRRKHRVSLCARQPV